MRTCGRHQPAARLGWAVPHGRRRLVERRSTWRSGRCAGRRGSTSTTASTILAATRELVGQVLDRNELKPDDVVSVVFTATRDLTAVAPALAARQLGLHDVALICAQEMWVEGSMPRVVRLLAHVETERPREAVVQRLPATAPRCCAATSRRAPRPAAAAP